MNRETATGQLLVVLVNYRLAAHIDRVLASGVLVGHRVVLVDNASEPDRVRELAANHGTELILLDHNYGFAGAVNRALAQVTSQGPVLLLNPDVHLDAAALSAMQQILIDRELTALTPLLLNVDGTIQVGIAGRSVSLARFAAYFLFISHILPMVHGVFLTRRQLSRGDTPEWVSMACLLLAADSFDRFGPIPEHELVYAEDVAWGLAASRAGARFAVVPEIRVVHEQGAAGASRRWSGALARLAVREHGRVQGTLARRVMAVGLTIRRLLGRRV